ncbi:MAG: hypothetical protein Kow0063_10600 [Anaerolineae bacterium]
MIATPFVQGRLREEALWVEVNTECAHCGQPLHMTLDSDLRYRVSQPDARPLVFQPLIDWTTFSEPNIIHAF